MWFAVKNYSVYSVYYKKYLHLLDNSFLIVRADDSPDEFVAYIKFLPVTPKYL